LKPKSIKISPNPKKKATISKIIQDSPNSAGGLTPRRFFIGATGGIFAQYSTSGMKEQIQQLARQYAPDMIAIRHHIHAHPELSFQEYETSKFVQQKLTEYGIAHSTLAQTGVVGIIEGQNPQSRCMALRADMDALPIQEESDISYKSTVAGVMHACGHDVHTTCLLGAARILAQTRSQWNGTVKLIFQPGEEKNPGGASIMIKEGVLQNPAPQGIIGMHVHTGMPAGQFSFRSGMVMASADELYITIKAKGGHAAAPQVTADPIVIAAQLVLNLQTIISRNNNPFNPSVLSITSIQGGSATNIIPGEVKIMGTFRAMNEDWRFKAHELIKKHVLDLAAMMGGSADVHIDVGYPFVLNNEALTNTAWRLAEDYRGKENVSQTELRMGAEDFGYYSHQIPGTFFRLGVMNEAMGITSGVHTSTFNIDEAAIEYGMGMMAWVGAHAVV
jgi:amidohydrolase